MKRHAAYTEWADAYSCTRHRCQPGGRNLAIYTVGCKRIEAPGSAIECEEVVEDTNMQFPYCCTRLRCLVLVRGEVWTRVLGQPWETLPVAPWSHMYKMKKPPPGDSSFVSKSPGEGPIYELTSDLEGDKVLRASKKSPKDNADCNEVVPRSMPTPDIVIALSTANEAKNHKAETNRHKRGRKVHTSSSYFEEDAPEHLNEIELEETATEKEKSPDALSDEKFYTNAYGVTQDPFKFQHHQAWVDIPSNQWNDHDLPLAEAETAIRENNLPDEQVEEKKEEKPSNLQALVDAIGTRMRDIENVVQSMSQKVHQGKPDQLDISEEKRSLAEADVQALQLRKRHKGRGGEENKELRDVKTKRPNPDGEHYKRFSVRNRGSKYLRITDSTTEQPLFIEDTNLNGYFSDASNSVVRRSNPANPLKAPAATYMAPVENRRKATHILVSEASEEVEKKHKKRAHKKKKSKRNHKKHHKDEKKKRLNKPSSVEIDKNVVSLEDSSAIAST